MLLLVHFNIVHAVVQTSIIIRLMGGGSARNPPVIEKIGKTPLSGEAGPPIRRAKRTGKFLGVLRNFLEKI